ncbi:MAG: RNA polymerase sigma factor [Planctomycetota bacterium]
MASESLPNDPEEILEHSGWIRRLAFSTLRDHELAEDVSQEVLLKALAAPRRSGRILKAWLATVTFHQAKNSRRGAVRRSIRETKVAAERADLEPQTPDLLAMHREVLDAVGALAPHYREVIRLRFFEDCSFREIGTKLGLTEGNARVRLHRALKELRGVMAGGGKDWRASCLALAHSLPSGTATTLSTSWWMVAAGILLLWCGWWSWNWIQTPAMPSGETAQWATATKESQQEPPTEAASLESLLTREVHKPTPTQSEDPAPSARTVLMQGQVLEAGMPVSNAIVRVWDKGNLSELATDESGLFEMNVDPDSRPAVSAYTTKASASRTWSSKGSRPYYLHLIEYPAEGRVFMVRDEMTGGPVSEAQVEVFVDWGNGDRETVGEDGHRFQKVGEGRTDSTGNFRLQGWFLGLPLVFNTVASGYFPERFARDLFLCPGITKPIQLLDTDQNPLADCLVWTGEHSGTPQSTDALGMIPNVQSWGPSHMTFKANGLSAMPSNLLLRLPDGRFWYASSYEHEPNTVSEWEDRICVVVDTTPLSIQAVDMSIPPDSWVEVRQIVPDGYYPKGLDTREGLVWHRVDQGESTTLPSGILGHFTEVQARIMPQDWYLGEFPIVDHKAIIDQQLCSLTVTLEADSQTLKKPLLLFVNQRSKPLRSVPVVNGVATIQVPFREESKRSYPDHFFNYKLSVQDTSTGKLILLQYPEGDQASDKISLQPGQEQMQVTLRASTSSWLPLQVRVNGIPVEGGTLNRQPIGLDGMTRILQGANGEVELTHLGLSLPTQLRSSDMPPLLRSMNLQNHRDHFPTIQEQGGLHFIDVELATVELLITQDVAGKLLGEKTGRLGSWIRHWPTWENSDPWEFIKTPSTEGWFPFRVPAGRYRFSVGEKTYGDEGGTEFAPGTITRLYPNEETEPPDSSTLRSQEHSSPASPK